MRTKIFMMVLLLVLLFLFFKPREKQRDDFLLLSDREAPLGWIYFTIYKDSTFEYVSRGLRGGDVYKGKAIIEKDTIFLNYSTAIPIVGKRVLYTEKYLEFIDLKFSGKIRIRLNKLK